MGEMQELRSLMAMKMMMMMMVLLIFLAVSSTNIAAAPISAAQCKLERKILVDACKPVVYGKTPSADCCQRIRVTDVECVCAVITPKLAAVIDVNRGIRIVQGCGRRVPRHFKCGSITTP